MGIYEIFSIFSFSWFFSYFINKTSILFFYNTGRLQWAVRHLPMSRDKWINIASLYDEIKKKQTKLSAKFPEIKNFRKMWLSNSKNYRPKIKEKSKPSSPLISFSPLSPIPSEKKWSSRWIFTPAKKISLFLSKPIQAVSFLSSRKVECLFILIKNLLSTWKRVNALDSYLCFTLLPVLLLSKLNLTVFFGVYIKAYLEPTQNNS